MPTARPDQSARRRAVASEVKRWTERARSLPDVRWDRVTPVRRALEQDAYETDDMLEAVLVPLASDLGAHCR